MEFQTEFCLAPNQSENGKYNRKVNNNTNDK